jgi:Trypsin-like peptidase domain
MTQPVGIMKTLWARSPEGKWGIHGLKSLALRPKADNDSDFFTFEDQVELLTDRPSGGIHELFSAFGTTSFLVKQSVMPVVVSVTNDSLLRFIGTAFVISCTGYVATACHVILDPVERKYGQIHRQGNTITVSDNVSMGVIIPANPAYGARLFRYFPFEQIWYWGEWKDSPLFHQEDRFDTLTDVAICKIPEMPNGAPHQPLNLSLNPFAEGEKAYALGYANMTNVPTRIENGRVIISDIDHKIYVSVGEVISLFADNHVTREVPTPGPCFDFRARIPGKMSGGPIFGADGAVVRGIVSRSFSGERHAYGAMLSPVIHLPLNGNETLKSMMETGREGIAKIGGPGL